MASVAELVRRVVKPPVRVRDKFDVERVTRAILQATVRTLNVRTRPYRRGFSFALDDQCEIVLIEREITDQ